MKWGELKAAIDKIATDQTEVYVNVNRDIHMIDGVNLDIDQDVNIKAHNIESPELESF